MGYRINSTSEEYCSSSDTGKFSKIEVNTLIIVSMHF